MIFALVFCDPFSGTQIYLLGCLNIDISMNWGVSDLTDKHIITSIMSMEVANQYTDPDTGFKVCVRQLFCHFDIFPSTSPSLRIWKFCRPSSYSCHFVTQMIPGTQRPDGTWRKPIRVREGYVPQVSFNLEPSLFN